MDSDVAPSEAPATPQTSAAELSRASEELHVVTIYDIASFFESTIAHTFYGKQYSSRTYEGVEIINECIANDVSAMMPDGIVMLNDSHARTGLIDALAKQMGNREYVIFVLSTAPRESITVSASAKDHVAFMPPQMFEKFAPVRYEPAAPEIFTNLMRAEFASEDESARMFKLGLTMRAQADAAMHFREGVPLQIATNAAAGNIVVSIIRDWKRVMEPSEITTLGKLVATAGERNALPRALNSIFVRFGNASARVFECQDMSEPAHNVAHNLEPHTDIVCTFSIRIAEQECEILCSSLASQEEAARAAGAAPVISAHPALASSTRPIYFARARIPLCEFLGRCRENQISREEVCAINDRANPWRAATESEASDAGANEGNVACVSQEPLPSSDAAVDSSAPVNAPADESAPELALKN